MSWNRRTTGGFAPTQTYTVAKSGGQYTSIKAAAAAAGGVAGPNTPCLVLVYPGEYSEANPVQLTNPWVVVQFLGRPGATWMDCQNAGLNGFEFGSNTAGIGLHVKGASGVGKAAYVISSGATGVHLEDTLFKDCDVGYLANNNSQSIITNGRVSTGPCTTVAKALATGGTIDLVAHSLICESGVNPTDFLKVEGTGAKANLWNGIGHGATNGIHADNGGEINVADVVLDGCTNAIRVGSGGGDIYGSNAKCENSGTYDAWAEGAASTLVLAGGLIDERLVSFHASADICMHFASTPPGDEGMAIYGELHVGRHGQGSESAFGEGDSHTIGMVVQRNANLEAGAWSDVTTEAASHSGSLATLLPGVGVGNCCYFGGDVPFPGLKVDVTTAVVLGGAGAWVLEYWTGAAWTAVSHMATDSGSPYAQYANTMFERVSSEQIRFGDMTGWATKTLNTITKYWVRLRVTAAITTSPVVEQSKLHTNRAEFNADGYLECFGTARPMRHMMWHLGIVWPIHTYTPIATDLDVTTNIVLEPAYNTFNNGAEDALGGLIHVPDGLDTSFPVTLSIIWLSDTNVGNVELELDYATSKLGDVWDGTAGDTRISTVVAVPGTAGAIKETTFDIPVDTVVPGEFIAIRFFRDATGGNDPPDTAVGDVIIAGTRVEGCFWR